MAFDIDAFETDMPEEIRAILRDAEAPYTRADEAQAALRAAVAHAPDNLALRIAAYTVCVYANRLHDAIPHAETCLAIAGRALGLPEDWRLVGPDSADFSGLERMPRVYLKSLLALGYCRARLGDRTGGEELLRKAASLDPPHDRIGAAALADLIARGGAREDEEEG
jgi:tetratricopeptide (TPR) repeat protein